MPSPGRYTIQSKTDRINDLVQARLGGLLNTANADGAFYTRRLAAISYRSRADSVRAAAKDTTQRVGIDLKDVLRNSNSSDNLLLEEGDSLDVPPMHATVEIKGAVNAPTVVAIAPGSSLEHYIGAAGGPMRRLAGAGGALSPVQPNRKIESKSPRADFLPFRSDAACGGDCHRARAGYHKQHGSYAADNFGGDWDYRGVVDGVRAGQTLRRKQFLRPQNKRLLVHAVAGP